jgi:folate-binding protein YgfZ
MLIDLCDRAKYKATGTDCKRFLNGQLTNDMLALRPGFAIYACALTAKGKLSADLYVAETRDAHYLDAEPLLRESLQARLERYIISDDVTLEDVTDQFGLFHLVDPEAPGRGPQELLMAGASEESGIFFVESNRFAIQGIDLWFQARHAAAVREILKQSPANSQTVEDLRIERGIARWGYELSEEILPKEAGLDDRAINFTKGCYLGQEVISRIKSIGRVNRHLRGLVPEDDVPIETGDKLFHSEDPGKEIGYVTSVGRSRKRARTIALGYVRRGFETDGTTLQVRRNNTLIGPIKVHSLPFESA